MAFAKREILKFIVILSCFFLFLNYSIVNSGIKEILISPQLNFHRPSSEILREYYNRNHLLFYGCETILFFDLFSLDRLGFGSFFKVQRNSFKVFEPRIDPIQQEIDITWLTFGIINNTNIQNINVLTKIGLTYHWDNLELSYDETRLGIQSSLAMNMDITTKIKYFIEIGYEYETLSIPFYLNSIPSRHQYYLAGKEFQTGGFLLQTGVSFSVYKLKE